MRGYLPKRPVRSFLDLEVYQKLLAGSVAVAKRIPPDPGNAIITKLRELAIALPLHIAAGHSIRFSDQQGALDSLEHAMLACNKVIVLLEQYRDIYNNDIEHEFFEEQIKTYLSVRSKVMFLQRSWKKFMEEKKREGIT